MSNKTIAKMGSPDSVHLNLFLFSRLLERKVLLFFLVVSAIGVTVLYKVEGPHKQVSLPSLFVVETNVSVERLDAQAESKQKSFASGWGHQDGDF